MISRYRTLVMMYIAALYNMHRHCTSHWSAWLAPMGDTDQSSISCITGTLQHAEPHDFRDSRDMCAFAAAFDANGKIMTSSSDPCCVQLREGV